MLSNAFCNVILDTSSPSWWPPPLYIWFFVSGILPPCYRRHPSPTHHVVGDIPSPPCRVTSSTQTSAQPLLWAAFLCSSSSTIRHLHYHYNCYFFFFYLVHCIIAGLHCEARNIVCLVLHNCCSTVGYRVLTELTFSSHY